MLTFLTQADLPTRVGTYYVAASGWCWERSTPHARYSTKAPINPTPFVRGGGRLGRGEGTSRPPVCTVYVPGIAHTCAACVVVRRRRRGAVKQRNETELNSTRLNGGENCSAKGPCSPCEAQKKGLDHSIGQLFFRDLEDSTLHR